MGKKKEKYLERKAIERSDNEIVVGIVFTIIGALILFGGASITIFGGDFPVEPLAPGIFMVIFIIMGPILIFDGKKRTKELMRLSEENEEEEWGTEEEKKKEEYISEESEKEINIAESKIAGNNEVAMSVVVEPKEDVSIIADKKREEKKEMGVRIEGE